MQELVLFLYFLALGILAWMDWRNRLNLPFFAVLGVFLLSIAVWYLQGANPTGARIGGILMLAGFVADRQGMIGDADGWIFGSFGFVFGVWGIPILCLGVWLGSVWQTLLWLLSGRPREFKSQISFIPFLFLAACVGYLMLLWFGIPL